MKIKQTLHFFIYGCLILLLSACEEGLESSCLNAGDIVHSIENGEAQIQIDPDTGVKIIRYHVPGTIDSILAGVVCSESFPDFLITENTRVRFSGHFRDDQGQLDPNVRLGGEEFFYLDLTFIEEIN